MSFYEPTYEEDPAPYRGHRTPFPSSHTPWLLPPIQSTLNSPTLTPHYQAIPSLNTLFPSSPPPNHTRPLYATIPLPSSKPSAGTTYLSPYLAPGSIEWNIRSPAVSASCGAHQLRAKAMRHAWQQEPATSPAQPFLVLRVSGSNNTTITVFPGEPNRAFVTVGDLLDCVHHAPDCAFGIPAAECDCRRCSAFDGRARHARSRAGEVAGVPQGSALMAVDLSYGVPPRRALPEGNRGVANWRWLGLVASTTEPEVWTLLLDARRGLGRIA